MRHAVRGLVGGILAAGMLMLAGGPWWGVPLLFVLGGNAAVVLSVALDLALDRTCAWAEREARAARNLRTDAGRMSPAVLPAPVRAGRRAARP